MGLGPLTALQTKQLMGRPNRTEDRWSPIFDAGVYAAYLIVPSKSDICEIPYVSRLKYTPKTVFYYDIMMGSPFTLEEIKEGSKDSTFFHLGERGIRVTPNSHFIRKCGDLFLYDTTGSGKPFVKDVASLVENPDALWDSLH